MGSQISTVRSSAVEEFSCARNGAPVAASKRMSRQAILRRVLVQDCVGDSPDIETANVALAEEADLRMCDRREIYI